MRRRKSERRRRGKRKTTAVIEREAAISIGEDRGTIFNSVLLEFYIGCVWVGGLLESGGFGATCLLVSEGVRIQNKHERSRDCRPVRMSVTIFERQWIFFSF